MTDTNKMRDESREQFEAVFSEAFPLIFAAAKAGEAKAHGDMSVAWWGWQASRQAVVVERSCNNENITLAQRLREYVNNPHHVAPTSEACERLIEDIARALAEAPSALPDELLTAAYWDFDARRKGYPPYHVPAGQECSAFKVAIVAAIEARGLRCEVKP